MTKQNLTLRLIGCVATKRPDRSPARDLYDASPLFRARRAYVEARTGYWAILSALHGIVSPEQEVSPYDKTVGSIAAVNSLAEIVAWQLDRRWCGYAVLEVHAGAPYVRAVKQAALISVDKPRVETPLAGLGIGEQLHWYKRQAEQLRRAGMTPAEILRDAVTGAIERGEAEAIVEQRG